jgi:hypothetical protein
LSIFQVANEGLLGCHILAAHEVIVDFDVAVFSRTQNVFVVWRDKEVGRDLLGHVELLSNSLNLSNVRIDPQILEF